MAKLQNIEITWELPWYQQSKCLTRPVVVNHGDMKENFRTDKITKEESDRIHKNWRKFRKLFNIPNNPECFARWKNTNKCKSPHTPEERVRRIVTIYLAKGLERTLYQVYRHILIRYGNPVKKKYSLEEEKLMEVCFYHNARNAVPILSTVLGREPRGIYKKLEEWLNGKPESKKLKWILPLATKFVKLLMKYTDLPLDELKYKRFDKKVWIKLEQDMEQQYIYLQKFWYDKLHVQIFVKRDIKINKLRRKIAKKLRESPYKVWSDIRWKELLKEFPDGFTHTFLYKTWANIFRQNKEIPKVSLEELIQYAINRIPSLPSRRLRTLTFNENGDLEEIRYEKVICEDEQ
ncbi:uncharacterized protein [Epargyreus clarus]